MFLFDLSFMIWNEHCTKVYLTTCMKRGILWKVKIRGNSHFKHRWTQLKILRGGGVTLISVKSPEGGRGWSKLPPGSTILHVIEFKLRSFLRGPISWPLTPSPPSPPLRASIMTPTSAQHSFDKLKPLLMYKQRHLVLKVETRI